MVCAPKNMRQILIFILLVSLAINSHGQHQVVININCNPSQLIYQLDSNGTNSRLSLTCSVNNEVNFTGHEKVLINNAAKEVIFKAFLAENKTIYSIPVEIADRFQNVEYLTIKSSKLQKITEEDLEKFCNMIYLDVSFNELKNLEADLFGNNPNLNTIWLNNNEIFAIDSTVFNGIEDVKFLNIDKNACYTGEARGLNDTKNLIKSNFCQGDYLKILINNAVKQEMEKFKENVTKVIEISSPRVEGKNSTSNLSTAEASHSGLLITIAFIVIVNFLILIILIAVVNYKRTLRNQRVFIQQSHIDKAKSHYYSPGVTNATQNRCSDHEYAKIEDYMVPNNQVEEPLNLNLRRMDSKS